MAPDSLSRQLSLKACVPPAILSKCISSSSFLQGHGCGMCLCPGACSGSSKRTESQRVCPCLPAGCPLWVWKP